ncbi:DUF4328 domain-containing protein [Streptomyces sp. NRRL WC-3549]|uniref:DUF4328 domain-containing protein n=1 Tax=Streptomyces sp. NRRL WC-3549 TaxID=1463925 RepID=UPI00068F1A1B|nr:DUF4328 domain-containing protein [Streptomyces sp. NRRL WC-3549]
MPGVPAPAAEGLHRLRSPRGLSTAVVALLGVVIVSDVFAVATDLRLWQAYADADGSDFTLLEPLERAESLFVGAAGFQALALVATAVLFLIWFRRVRHNAEVFDAGAQPMKPGWAIGAWFVPIANCWLPRQIASGIWTASTVPDTEGNRRGGSQALLNLWWALWVFGLLFGRFASNRYEKAVLFDDVTAGLRLLVVSDALDILAAVLALLVVRRLTAMQGERAALLAHPGRQVPDQPDPPTVFSRDMPPPSTGAAGPMAH